MKKIKRKDNTIRRKNLTDTHENELKTWYKQMNTLFTIIKFILKWSLIFLGLYFGFWIAIGIIGVFIILGGVLGGIGDSIGPRPYDPSQNFRGRGFWF